MKRNITLQKVMGNFKSKSINHIQVKQKLKSIKIKLKYPKFK